MERLDKLLNYEYEIKIHGYNFASGKEGLHIDKLMKCTDDIDDVITSIIYVMKRLDEPLFTKKYPSTYFERLVK